MGIYAQLFRTASRAARRELAEDFRRSPAGRLLALTAGRGGRDEGAAGRFLDALRRGMEHRDPSRILGFRFGTVAYAVERYAKRDDPGGEIMRAWLQSLGPAGQLLRTLFGDPTAGVRSQAAMLTAAIRLVQAFGMEVLPNPQSGFSPQLRARGRAAAWRYLRDIGELDALAAFGGYEELANLDPSVFEQRLTVPPGESAAPPGRIPGFDDLPDNHPLFTGEFREVKSSNVHSVAYDAREGVLYVRFLHKRWDKTLGDWVPAGPGPIYAYYDVMPELFLDLLRANSPGGWVWDHLRIRGTVSGHRYDYRLVAIHGNYVPRKATFMPLTPGDYMGEYAEVFLPREVIRGPRRTRLRSLKPFEVVRTFRPSGPIPPGRAVLFGADRPAAN